MLKYVVFTLLIAGQIHCADQFPIWEGVSKQTELEQHLFCEASIVPIMTRQWALLANQYNLPKDNHPLRIWMKGKSIHALDTNPTTITYRIISLDDEVVRIVGELSYDLETEYYVKKAMIDLVNASLKSYTVMAGSYAAMEKLNKQNNDLKMFAAGAGAALTAVAVTKVVTGETCTIL